MPARRTDMLLRGLGLLSFALILSAIVLVFWHAPTDGTLGIVQKIFYFHVPAAIASYLGFGVCALGSIFYLLKPDPTADRLAHGGAEVGILFAICVLITGPLWAYKAWGTFWEWDPRLTSVLLTFLIYFSYLLLRRFGPTGELSRKVAAVMGTLGVVGVAISHVSVRLWGGVHPQVITGQGGGIQASMKPAFAVSMTGLLLLALVLILLRARIAAQLEEVDSIYLRLSEFDDGEVL